MGIEALGEFITGQWIFFGALSLVFWVAEGIGWDMAKKIYYEEKAKREKEDE